MILLGMRSALARFGPFNWCWITKDMIPNNNGLLNWLQVICMWSLALDTGQAFYVVSSDPESIWFRRWEFRMLISFRGWREQFNPHPTIVLCAAMERHHTLVYESFTLPKHQNTPLTASAPEFFRSSVLFSNNMSTGDIQHGAQRYGPSMSIRASKMITYRHNAK